MDKLQPTGSHVGRSRLVGFVLAQFGAEGELAISRKELQFFFRMGFHLFLREPAEHGTLDGFVILIIFPMILAVLFRIAVRHVVFQPPRPADGGFPLPRRDANGG